LQIRDEVADKSQIRDEVVDKSMSLLTGDFCSRKNDIRAEQELGSKIKIKSL
jgi:hypothetical protein